MAPFQKLSSEGTVPWDINVTEVNAKKNQNHLNKVPLFWNMSIQNCFLYLLLHLHFTLSYSQCWVDPLLLWVTKSWLCHTLTTHQAFSLPRFEVSKCCLSCPAAWQCLSSKYDNVLAMSKQSKCGNVPAAAAAVLLEGGEVRHNLHRCFLSTSSSSSSSNYSCTEPHALHCPNSSWPPVSNSFTSDL